MSTQVVWVDHFKVTNGPWKNKTLFELYSETYLPWEWYDDMFTEAHRLRIQLFASVFDEVSADFISKYNSNRVKIASPELVDLKLISLGNILLAYVEFKSTSR